MRPARTGPTTMALSVLKARSWVPTSLDSLGIVSHASTMFLRHNKRFLGRNGAGGCGHLSSTHLWQGKALSSVLTKDSPKPSGIQLHICSRKPQQKLWPWITHLTSIRYQHRSQHAQSSIELASLLFLLDGKYRENNTHHPISPENAC